MSGNFHFVNGLEQNNASRKLLRRHVMMGRNAGKRLNRPSKRALQQTRGCQKQAQYPISGWTDHILEHERLDIRHKKAEAYWIYVSDKVIARSLGDRIETFSLPVDVPYQAMSVLNGFFSKVVEHLYPVTLGLSLHEMKYLWLQTMCTDSDAFKGCISIMSACNDLILGNGTPSHSSLHHLTETIQIVKRRLASDQALSNSTIAIVLSLVQQEQMRDELGAARTHAKGLGKMVELRGGLESIEQDGAQNKLLVLKLCKTDIRFALQYGEPLMFYRDRMTDVRAAMSKQGLHLNRVPLPPTSPAQPLHPYLAQTLQDVAALCALFNAGLHAQTLDVVTHLEAATSLLYCLLRFQPVGPCLPQSVTGADAAYHVGLVLFTGMLFMQRGSRQILQCAILNRRVREVVQRGFRECSDKFAFWVVVTVGVWLDDGDIDWLLPKIRGLAVKLGLGSWDEGRTCLRRIAWIDSLLDESGLQLWNKTWGSAEDEYGATGALTRHSVYC